MEKELEKNLEEASVKEDTTAKVEDNNTVENSVENETVAEDIVVEESTDSLKEEKVLSEENTSEYTETVVKEVAKKTSNKRILQGVVVSNKPDKTIVIKVVRQVAHPLYKKYYKKSNKFMAHDPNNDCNIGDIVKVKEARPLSKRKRWELIEIVDRAK